MKNCIIGILAVLVLALGGFIIYDKVIDKKDVKEPETTNTEVEEKLPEWVEYLLKQDITEITYESGIALDGNGPLTCEAAKTMTKEQLKDVLVKMSEAPITKFDLEGIGGPCWGGIKVKYGNKVFNIYMGKLVITANNDTAVIAMLDKEDYVLNTTTNDAPNWSYEFGWDPTYIDTLLKAK